MFDIPIIYFNFNRPKITKQSFEVLRFIKPKHLFLVVDGPRDSHIDDFENCLKVKEILSQIDWDSDVRRNFSDKNLGLQKRLSSGIDWAFSYVEKAIILEDDCIPHPDFFKFCKENNIELNTEEISSDDDDEEDTE